MKNGKPIGLGGALALLRLIAGLDQKSFARAAGVSSATISLVERDMRGASMRTLKGFAKALAVEPYEILLLSGQSWGNIKERIRQP